MVLHLGDQVGEVNPQRPKPEAEARGKIPSAPLVPMLAEIARPQGELAVVGVLRARRKRQLLDFLGKPVRRIREGPEYPGKQRTVGIPAGLNFRPPVRTHHQRTVGILPVKGRGGNHQFVQAQCEGERMLSERFASGVSAVLVTV